MKGIISLCKVFAQSLHLQAIPASTFRISLQEKYPPPAVLATINDFVKQKGWVWSGKFAYITGVPHDRWEIIMHTSSGSYRNIGILDNGELESIFYLKEEVSLEPQG